MIEHEFFVIRLNHRGRFPAKAQPMSLWANRPLNSETAELNRHFQSASAPHEWPREKGIREGETVMNRSYLKLMSGFFGGVALGLFLGGAVFAADLSADSLKFAAGVTKAAEG